MHIQIYTSCFHNIGNSINPVSIARNEPKWFKNAQYFQSYKKLAPSWKLLGKAKSGKIDFTEYIDQYYESVLNNLSPLGVIEELNVLFGDEMTLLCWEKDFSRCHRRLFAKWLKENIDLHVPEL